MKTTIRVLPFALPIALALLVGLFLFRGKAQVTPPAGPSPIFLAGWKPVEDRPLVDSETQQLNSLLATATAAANSIAAGPDAGAKRRAVDLELCAELESFVTNNPASTWTPAIHLALGRKAQLRCGYTAAMDHYEQAFGATEHSSGYFGRTLAMDASGRLAKLLALSGQLTAESTSVMK